MADDTKPTLRDDDRVSHAVKGLGTVKTQPAEDDLVIAPAEAAKSGPDMVYVVWDDDRFPVGRVPAAELELVPAASAAISSGV